MAMMQVVGILFVLGCSLPLAKLDSNQTIGLRRSLSDSHLYRNKNPIFTPFHRQSSFRKCHTDYRFDYTQLTLMWAPGTCRTSPHACKRTESKHFTIHGMWPTLKGTEEPDFCCFDNTFDYDSIKPLLPALNEYWFSYYDVSDSRSFWEHEWLKHGTCARDIPALRGESKYFGITLGLAQKLDVLGNLKKSNIVPDNDKPYKSSDIYNVLSKLADGKVPQIDCDFEHHQSIPILTGVNFCFDSNLEFSDCPQMKLKCQRLVYFVNN